MRFTPGDRLHAKVKYLNPNSTIYRLAEYRIMEYDADEIVKNEAIQEVKDGVLENEIPTNFTGTEMSIIPVGEYPKRNLSMSVYYVDDSGNKCSLGMQVHGLSMIIALMGILLKFEG